MNNKARQGGPEGRTAQQEANLEGENPREVLVGQRSRWVIYLTSETYNNTVAFSVIMGAAARREADAGRKNPQELVYPTQRHR